MLHIYFDSDLLGVTGGSLSGGPDADAQNFTFGLDTRGFNYVFDRNATDWNRMDASADDGLSGDNIAASGNLVYDRGAGDWNRMDSAADDSLSGDNVLLAQVGAYDGTIVDRVRNSSVANLTATTQPYQLGVSSPGEWSVNHVPAANTLATATKAAGAAGVRHVLRSLTFCLSGAGSSVLAFGVDDGVSGTGSYLWRSQGVISSEGVFICTLSNLNIIGSAATAMTIEWGDAGGPGTYEGVCMSGYSVI